MLVCFSAPHRRWLTLVLQLPVIQSLLTLLIGICIGVMVRTLTCIDTGTSHIITAAAANWNLQ